MVQKKILEFHHKFSIHLQIFTDYNELQQFETAVLETMGEYQNFMEKEISNRNKSVNAIEKQVEIISRLSNSTGILLERSQILQQIRAEENKKAIEELKHKTKKLKSENKEIENF